MKSNIRVCHVSSVHPRYDTRILLKECVSLREAGYKVSLVINDKEKNEIYKGVKIYSTKTIFSSRIKRIILGVLNVYKLAKSLDADIYHLHDPELLLVALFLKRKGKKVIFDSHEAYFLQIKEKTYIPFIFRTIISKLYRMLEKFVVKRLDAVICPGTIMGKNIFQNCAKKTVFIDNLPRLEDVAINLNENIAKEDRAICYVGNLSAERGITNLVLAAYKANATLYLAGKFSSEEYEKELSEMKEYNNIKYLGYLNKKEIYDLFNKVNIGMCTLLGVGQYNKGDNLPTKVYEYMLGGLPVILSDFSYNRRMIENYKFGVVVNPDSINEIANIINLLLSNKSESTEMGKRGRKVVLEKYNWNKEKKKLLSLYDKLIKER